MGAAPSLKVTATSALARTLAIMPVVSKTTVRLYPPDTGPSTPGRHQFPIRTRD